MCVLSLSLLFLIIFKPENNWKKLHTPNRKWRRKAEKIWTSWEEVRCAQDCLVLWAVGRWSKMSCETSAPLRLAASCEHVRALLRTVLCSSCFWNCMRVFVLLEGWSLQKTAPGGECLSWLFGRLFRNHWKGCWQIIRVAPSLDTQKCNINEHVVHKRETI